MADGPRLLADVIDTALSPLRQDVADLPRLIECACPVPFFGDAEHARIASVGLNPSDREFRDTKRRWLRGDKRRLETLDSLGLGDWTEAGPKKCLDVAEACSNYFGPNQYWWFRRLKEIFVAADEGTLDDGGACHIDLVPWATEKKWRELKRREKDALLECAKPTFKKLLSSTRLEVLLLNGAGVVDGFERVTGMRLSGVEEVKEWQVHRGKSRRWPPQSHALTDLGLERSVTILGWNWNLQSPIPKQTRGSITMWAARSLKESLKS